MKSFTFRTHLSHLLLASCMTGTAGNIVAAPPTAPPPKVEIVAHRGASHDAPENTLPAVMEGWKQGADAVEIDIYLSKDDKIVVIHDKDTKRTGGGRDKPVVEQTLAELRELDMGAWKSPKFKGTKIPVLAEVLTTIPEGKRLFIEVKCGPEIVPVLKRELDTAGLPPEQTPVISFNKEVCAAVRETIPALQVYWLTSFKKDKETGALKPTAKEAVETAKRLGVHGLDAQAGEGITPELVNLLKEAKLPLYVWTVDDPAVAERMRALGAISVTTNKPGLMQKELNSLQE